VLRARGEVAERFPLEELRNLHAVDQALLADALRADDRPVGRAILRHVCIGAEPCPHRKLGAHRLERRLLVEGGSSIS